MRKAKNQYRIKNDGTRTLWNGYDYDLQKWVVRGVTYDTTEQAYNAVEVALNNEDKMIMYA